MKASPDSLRSSHREALIEHLLVGEIMKHLWHASPPVELEILKPQVDDAGYDLALEARGVLRHLQLKSKSASNWPKSLAAAFFGYFLTRTPLCWVRSADSAVNRLQSTSYRRLQGCKAYKVQCSGSQASTSRTQGRASRTV